MTIALRPAVSLSRVYLYRAPIDFRKSYRGHRLPGQFSHEARKIYMAINIERSLDAEPILN